MDVLLTTPTSHGRLQLQVERSERGRGGGREGDREEERKRGRERGRERGKREKGRKERGGVRRKESK